MAVAINNIADTVVLSGPQFSEPVYVMGTPSGSNGFVLVNLVGTSSHRFPRSRSLATLCHCCPRISKHDLIGLRQSRLVPKTRNWQPHRLVDDWKSVCSGSPRPPGEDLKS
jgi:hypothetical protein